MIIYYKEPVLKNNKEQESILHNTMEIIESLGMGGDGRSLGGLKRVLQVFSHSAVGPMPQSRSK